MTTTVSIAELLKAGVALDAAEAVAITQQLIRSLRASPAADIEPPFGPPTAETVIVDADGSVSCAGCGATPAISEVAIFLDSLLPHGSPRVPGGLRYTIARALLEVDVAPFDSLDAFSDALARHEHGDRVDVIRRLFRRSESPCAIAVFVQADRRRPRANATELRRALREADARLYAHQVSTRQVIQERRQPPIRGASAVAACVGAGLMLVAAGEVMQREDMPNVAAAPIVTAAPLPDTARSAVEVREEPTSLVGTIPAPPAELSSPVSDSSLPPPRIQGMAKKRSERAAASPTTTRAPRTTAKMKQAGAQRPGVLDRLKLRWLRKAFVLRVDEL
jgi:hypothetical protein